MKGSKETTNKHRAYCLSLLNRYSVKKWLPSQLLNYKVSLIIYLNLVQHIIHCVALTMEPKWFCLAKEVGLIEINPVEASFVQTKKMTWEEITTEETSKLYLETDELKEFLSYVDKHRNIMYRTLIYIHNGLHWYAFRRSCCFKVWGCRFRVKGY